MRPTFNHLTGEIALPPDATPYALAHERAHQWQQRTRTLAWRLFERTEGWPFVSRTTRLMVEWEAARMALKALRLAGRCDRHARSEARAGLWSYVRACFGG